MLPLCLSPTISEKFHHQGCRLLSWNPPPPQQKINVVHLAKTFSNGIGVIVLSNRGVHPGYLPLGGYMVASNQCLLCYFILTGLNQRIIIRNTTNWCIHQARVNLTGGTLSFDSIRSDKRQCLIGANRWRKDLHQGYHMVLEITLVLTPDNHLKGQHPFDTCEYKQQMTHQPLFDYQQSKRGRGEEHLPSFSM